jgi:hypothetical protein
MFVLPYDHAVIWLTSHNVGEVVDLTTCPAKGSDLVQFRQYALPRYASYRWDGQLVRIKDKVHRGLVTGSSQSIVTGRGRSYGQ